MKKLVLSFAFLLVSSLCEAQGTVTFKSPDNALTIPVATSLTYTLYVTPTGSPTISASLVAVTCTGATVPFTCSGSLPASLVSATSLGARSELSAKTSTGAEGPKSGPFIMPPTAPVELSISK